MGWRRERRSPALCWMAVPSFTAQPEEKLQVCSRWAPRKQKNLLLVSQHACLLPSRIPFVRRTVRFLLLLGFWLTGNSVFCITERPVILMGLRGKIGCKINHGRSHEILCVSGWEGIIMASLAVRTAPKSRLWQKREG